MGQRFESAPRRQIDLLSQLGLHRTPRKEESHSADQPVARSGTTNCREFCGTSCLKMTRLLNTPIIGRWAKTVASSWMDMLAGL